MLLVVIPFYTLPWVAMTRAAEGLLAIRLKSHKETINEKKWDRRVFVVACTLNTSNANTGFHVLVLLARNGFTVAVVNVFATNNPIVA